MALSSRQKKIGLVLVASVVTATMVVGLFGFTPSPPAGRFPSDLSDAEKREIGAVIRTDGFRRSFGALSRLEFAYAWGVLRNTTRQSVWDVGQQGNGDIWLHVGFADKSQSHGYQLTARFIMTKSNGHWKIGSSEL